MWVRYGVHNRRLIDCIEFNRYKQVIGFSQRMLCNVRNEGFKYFTRICGFCEKSSLSDLRLQERNLEKSSHDI